MKFSVVLHSIWLLVFSGLLTGVALSQTLSPQRLLGRYQQFIWNDQHGLPQNGISAIAQTPEGYLWMATAEGVVRFDGVRFTAFDNANTSAIKSNNVQALVVDHTGTLWIGTHGGGLSSYKDGRFANYGLSDGLSDSHIKCLFEDRAGNIWIGTDGGGLNRLEPRQPGPNGRIGRFTVYQQQAGLPDNYVWAITEDAAGDLWIGTNNALARLKAERFQVYQNPAVAVSNGLRTLYFDRDGDLWIGSRAGLSRFRAGQFIPLKANAVPSALKEREVHTIYQDNEGTLWFGVIGAGLVRLKDGRFDICSEAQGLASDSIQAIFQGWQSWQERTQGAGAHGDLWLGTSGGGLVQLRSGRFTTYTTAEGVPNDMVTTVWEDQTGAIWVGTEGGLGRFKDNRFMSITAPDGRPISTVGGIRQDTAGNFWITSSDRAVGKQVARYREGDTRVEFLTGEAFQVRNATMLQDRAGRTWIAKSYDGLTVLQNGQRTNYHKADGLADDYVDALFEDRQGNIWIGTRSGVTRFKDGRFTTWTTQNGLQGNHILSFYEDVYGALWIGTHGDGLHRFKDGKFSVITTRQGLYDNLAFQILSDRADGSGNLWMSGNKGIYRASLQELTDCAEGRRATVNSFSYGVADGMFSRECNGGNPAGIQARDGRFWFPTIKGVVVVDPHQLNVLPPAVVVEKIMVDGVALQDGQALEIKPGQENLEIQYTALSWSRPQQLRFKYQLVGLDKEWVEAGTRRAAYYPHLPSGNYTFRVIADNGEGVWNEVGAKFDLVVTPPFYRTWWFLCLIGLGVAGLALSGYKLRVRQLQRANAAQQEFSRRLLNAHEGERQRIAAELHDGLSQSLAIIRQRATICLQAKDDPERQQEQLEEIAESATAVIDEVRDIIYDLRPVQLDRLGLINSLREMLTKVGRAHGVQIEHELDELAGRLPKESENSLYRIVQEAVNNIVRHAHASAASVRLKVQPHSLRLDIADNGCGFIPDATRDWVAGSGLGLTGIHERTRLLRGQLLVESAPQQGTTLTILLPLPELPEPKS